MTNRFRGETTATVDGRTFKLRLDFDALAAFETATDKNALACLAEIEGGQARAADIIAMVRAAMQRHHPDDTGLAGDLLSEDVTVLRRLLEACAPDSGGDVAGNPTAPAP